ncbi:ABC transporter ATP-binding protein [Marinagarivorans algicola]|uniref:ABC transporter ATP-binding protein n=1 Tax=Marinagarivorans algicola TaxID=1513270 RepID=UPI0009EBB2A7|nr:ABC transporter ATP-binding protein [Marinagarivorans algicola]
MGATLTLNNVTCHYPTRTLTSHTDSTAAHAVVNALSLSLVDGEIGSLLGASGCGKTTVLRSIAGFHAISEGDITLGTHMLSSAHVHLAPEKRSVGMVFQDYALFPHLTVAQNILFGLKGHAHSTPADTCLELLRLVKLTGLEHRYPNELSGGQQQRVALARALAPSPKLLLLDEPLSNLDTELRRGLALELRDILKTRKTSALMVTHDQQEAFAFADKLGIVNQGRIEQWDTPYNIYHKPATRYVAKFVGQGVLLPGFARSGDSIECELGLLKNHQPHHWAENTALDVLLRPDDIIEDGHSPYRAIISHKLFAGTSTIYSLKLPTGAELSTALPSHDDFEVGREIGIRVAADHLIAFPSQIDIIT